MAKKPSYEELERRVQELEKIESKYTASREALRKSESLFRMLYEKAPLGYQSLDENGHFIVVNKTWLEALGYAKEEVIGKSFADFLHPDWREHFKEYFPRFKSIGEVLGVEFEMIKKNGDPILVSFTGKISRDEKGKFQQTHCIFHDITERKLSEEALRESENQISSIFRSAPVGIGSVVNRVLIKINNRLCEMTGYDETELIGHSSRMLYPSDEDFEFVGREKYAQIADHGTGMVETRWQKKDGTIIDVLLSSTPVDLKDHSKGVTFTALDITERKQTERALVEQKDLLAAIYRNAPLIIMVVNAERRIQQVNGFAAQFVGRDVEEMLGLRGGEALRCMHVLDDPRGCGFGEFCQQCVIRNTVLDTLETGKTHLQIEAPYYFKGQDNETQDLQFFMSTTSIEVKGERMVLVTLQDITEHKQAEAEKEKLQEQLNQAQKLESVGRLAGGVAHDFNNMLGVILGHTELALLKVDEDNDLVSDLKEIQKAAKRSTDTTKQLLAFARKDIISPKKIDLNDTVESMLNMLRRLIGEDIDLVWQPSTHLWSVKLDPSQIDQILVNLCVNARDAISGVGKLTIETGKKTFDEEYCNEHPGFIPGDFVLLAVSDNGCGMDKETLANLFEPFFTTKEVGKGTGDRTGPVFQGTCGKNQAPPGSGIHADLLFVLCPGKLVDRGVFTAGPDHGAHFFHECGRHDPDFIHPGISGHGDDRRKKSTLCHCVQHLRVFIRSDAFFVLAAVSGLDHRTVEMVAHMHRAEKYL
jgi:PAS domain S-box-containing protein